MTRSNEITPRRPSLETLVESGLLELESLHPGGLALTEELASLCAVGADAKVLDVACGTGASACHLAERFGARVYGLDHSEPLLDRARDKAETRGLAVTFHCGSAEALPFADAAFDAVICECTLCLLDKTTALREMTRVVRSRGCVGIHDLCWRQSAPESLKKALAQTEDEEPETLQGWQRLFINAGLIDVRAVDRSEVKTRWMREMRSHLGLSGQLALGLQVVRRWGIAGLWSILRAERVFSNADLGYAIVVGVKP